MRTIDKSVDVQAPVSTAYNQWTQFESFPTFMEGVDRVRQLTDTRTHWNTSIGGIHREFDAEITEQHPDERIAWRSVSGPPHAGVITFHRLDDRTTRVHLQMEYLPSSLPEKLGTALGMVGHRIGADLQRYKLFLEDFGRQTGAWRGDVPRPPQEGEAQQQTEPGEPPRGDRGGTSSRSVPPGGVDQPPA